MDNLEVSGPTALPPSRDPAPKRPTKPKVRKPKPSVPEEPSDGDDGETERGTLDLLT
jgi:hypothetical protein